MPRDATRSINTRFQQPHLCFYVEELDPESGNLHEMLACCANAVVARAAFDAAVQQRPDSALVYRHLARVIATHNRN